MMETQEWGRKLFVECVQFSVHACLVIQIEVKNLAMANRTFIILFTVFLLFS